jgi:hypothetical protein
MSLRRVAYLLLILVIAGGSALVGAAAGGFAVYRAVQGQPNNLPAPIQEILPANNTNPGKHLLSTTQTWKPRSRNLFKSSARRW